MLGLKLVGLISALLISGVSASNVDNVGVYADTMVVTEVDYEGDVVTIADFNGFEWQFEGCEDWIEGDVCSVLMCDNGTEVIFDDVILSTTYSGWVNEWGWEDGCPLYTFDFE